LEVCDAFAALLLGVLLVTGVRSTVGPAAASAAAPDAADLPGVYECQGTGADGRPYRGAVIIEPDGGRFVLRWVIDAQLTAIGVGIRGENMLALTRVKNLEAPSSAPQAPPQPRQPPVRPFGPARPIYRLEQRRNYCSPIASATINAAAPSAINDAHHGAAKRSHSS
jgi:hypothetical protein